MQKQPSCEEGDEGLKSLVPMKPLFGGANGSDTQDAASGEGEGINVQLFFLIPKSPGCKASCANREAALY